MVIIRFLMAVSYELYSSSLKNLFENLRSKTKNYVKLKAIIQYWLACHSKTTNPWK